MASSSICNMKNGFPLTIVSKTDNVNANQKIIGEPIEINNTSSIDIKFHLVK
jgi:hypothetical protein